MSESEKPDSPEENPPKQDHLFEGTPSLKPAFETMISNIEDILSSCEAIHGKEYKNLLIFFFGGESNLSQLESLSCDMSQVLGRIAKEDDNSPMFDKASYSHDMSHALTDQIHASMNGIAVMMEATGKFPDLCKNIQMIVDRANTDFLSKLNAHMGEPE